MIRRRTALAVALLFLPLLALAFFACGGPAFTSSPGGSDGGGGPDVTSPVTPDSGGTDGSAPDTGPGDASPPHADGGASSVLYVSAPNGSDLNDGLSISTPKKTIAGALVAASALDAGALEVHVCAGTYPETNLSIGSAISLRGSYGCSSWVRTATFGYPTFDGKSATLVQNASPATQDATLILNQGVPSTSIVDGLVIEGAASSTSSTTGLAIRESASPLVTDDVITGGGGHPAAGNGSYGVTILGSSSAQLEHCAINGGGGTGGIGSTGVEINSTGTPSVHDCVISGGLGTSNSVVATRGLWIESSAQMPNGIVNDVVTACDAPGVPQSTAGIRVAASDASAPIAVDIIGCQVSGGLGTDAGGSSLAIQIDSTGAAVTLVDDRIYGGARGGIPAFAAGVYVQTASTVLVANSMIHGGDVAGTGASSNGVVVLATTAASIVDDTIYAGPFGGDPISLQTGATGTVIRDVILLGAGPENTHPAVYAETCANAPANLDHAVFANFGGALYDCVQTDGGILNAATIPDLETALSSDAGASDFIYASPDAGACPGTPSACLGTLFGAAWTADDGITGLFPQTTDAGTIAGGWTLPATAPCAIVHGGSPLPGIATDLYDVTRSATPTLGAAEVTDSGCP